MLIPLILCAGLPITLGGEEAIPIAIFDFDSKEETVRDLGAKTSAMLNAHLSTAATLITVERAEIDKVLSEQELGLSGVIAPQTAAQVGHLTGAKILVTGRVFRVDKELVLVAKIIGTENGRVFGEMVKGDSAGSLTKIAEELASKISRTIGDRSGDLLVRSENRTDLIQRIKQQIRKPPVVKVTIPERHFNGPTFDPAAETELIFILRQCGFQVLEASSSELPDIELKGEAISELGLRKGNLVSCKGRVELKAIRRADGRILQGDRQTSVAVDLSEQMAAKTALQRAAQELAARILPKLASGESL